MHNLFLELRYGIRMLAKSPGFAAIAVLTLGLGIGANTAIFTVMQAVVLRSLPVDDAEQLVELRTNSFPEVATQTGMGSLSFNFATFDEMRTRHEVFRDLMAYIPLAIGKTAVRYGELAEEARGDMVSGNFFSGLGVAMARGRGFALEDEQQHTQTVVLSYRYWTRRFGRNSSILGQALFVKGVPFCPRRPLGCGLRPR